MCPVVTFTKLYFALLLRNLFSQLFTNKEHVLCLAKRILSMLLTWLVSLFSVPDNSKRLTEYELVCSMFPFDQNCRLRFIFTDKALHCATDRTAEVISFLKSCLVKCSKSLKSQNEEWCDTRICKCKWHIGNLGKTKAPRTKAQCRLHVCKCAVLLMCSVSSVRTKSKGVFVKLRSYQTVVKNRRKFWHVHLRFPLTEIYWRHGNSQKSKVAGQLIGVSMLVLEVWFMTNLCKMCNNCCELQSKHVTDYAPVWQDQACPDNDKPSYWNNQPDL